MKNNQSNSTVNLSAPTFTISKRNAFNALKIKLRTKTNPQKLQALKETEDIFQKQHHWKNS